MDTIETVYEYHERTKHRPHRYAASLGYMDWAARPDPFRTYEATEVISLPLPDDAVSPAYSELFSNDTVTQPLTKQSLSALLRFSLGLAAWKCLDGECWALRCNASSGNLHPTEGYIIAPAITGICTQSFLAHYRPKTHALEILHTFDCDIWETLPDGTFLFALTSVVWREAWKYGERAFRYTQLDAGHALRAVSVSAALQGWENRLIHDIDVGLIDTMLGLDKQERFTLHEDEIADCLMILSPQPFTRFPDFEALSRILEGRITAKANRLSPSHHPWEAITLVEKATHTPLQPLPKTSEPATDDATSSLRAAKVILERRSAQAMDFARAQITFDDFMQLLRSSRIAFRPFESACSLVLFVHNVETLDSGLYLYLLNPKYLRRFKEQMHDDFIFQSIADNLYLLEKGDFRPQAKFISCSQDIASDGSFSLGMLCDFESQLALYGASRYKSLYWECGAIGQQLYLQATSLGLSATGIGCFLDDVMHRLLGLEDRSFQSLYHFTVGRAIVDSRLSTKAPYHYRTDS